MHNTLKEITAAPALIKESELKILEFKNVIAETKKQMDFIKRNTACEVASEMVEGNKKAFPNAESREAETEKRLLQNDKYLELQSSLAQAETQRSEEEINLRYITDTFSANRYKVKLYTADKVERAATNFLGAVQIAAGLSELLSKFGSINPTSLDSTKEKFDDCPF
jgi:hypothetical protein